MLALIQQYRLILTGTAIAALMALSAYGAWIWQANAYTAQIETMQADQARSLAAAQAKARSEEQRRQTAVEGIRTDAHHQIEQAKADAAAATARADSLQQQAARVASRPICAAGNPGSASGGPPANAPALLLADVLQRIDARAGELAAAADLARIAGQACERSFDSLSR